MSGGHVTFVAIVLDTKTNVELEYCDGIIVKMRSLTSDHRAGDIIRHGREVIGDVLKKKEVKSG